MAETMNIQLGAKFKLLKADLSAVFEKNGTKNTFLLSPTPIEEAPSVSLEEMIKDFKDAFAIEGDEIKKNLEEVGKGNTPLDLTKLRFTLLTAYFYKSDTITEYAFAVEVDCGDAIPNLGFIKVEKLSFAIWNTERNKVLTSLKLHTINDSLALLD